MKISKYASWAQLPLNHK